MDKSTEESVTDTQIVLRILSNRKTRKITFE